MAVPGRHTTAYFLLSLYAQGFVPVEVRYDRILPMVAQGEVEAGLIIHESRFTYPRYGLVQVVDLGAWWEERTGLPCPWGPSSPGATWGKGLSGLWTRRCGEAWPTPSPTPRRLWTTCGPTPRSFPMR